MIEIPQQEKELTRGIDKLVPKLKDILANGSKEEIYKVVSRINLDRSAVYRERDKLISVLSKLWPSHLSLSDKSNRFVVCVHSPEGQLTWHVLQQERDLFLHLKFEEDHWDGHTTEEKYKRLKKIKFKKGKNI